MMIVDSGLLFLATLYIVSILYRRRTSWAIKQA